MIVFEEPEKAGGGALNARREHFGVVFAVHTGVEVSVSAQEARAFAIQLLVLCEYADQAWAEERYGKIVNTEMANG